MAITVGGPPLHALNDLGIPLCREDEAPDDPGDLTDEQPMRLLGEFMPIPGVDWNHPQLLRCPECAVLASALGL